MLTNPINNKKIRFPLIGGLVFSFLWFGCSESKKEPSPVTIQWNGRKAESITIPREWLPGIVKDSIEPRLHIQLSHTNIPMLGEYDLTDEAVVFRPLIAFTRGLKYEIRLSGKLVSEIVIPSDSTLTATRVISIYPTTDTVPVNLLKIYIAFSTPMQEGQALQNIAVIKNKRDTVPSVFLDLQPELWNKERTILTLWLDPGRIKRDLQPNIRMGTPLQQGISYQVVVNKDWRDAEGQSLEATYQKEFFVGLRDSESPDAESWTIHAPKAGNRDPLRIDLHESLDYILLKNAIRIVDKKGNVIDGVIETTTGETTLHITPTVVWASGVYTIEIESRLEDLAGNNLNRLFDKDLSRQTKEGQQGVFKRSFHIQ